MRVLTLALAAALGLVLTPGGVSMAQSAPRGAAADRPTALKTFDAKIEMTKQAMMGDPMIARQSAQAAVWMALGLRDDARVSAREATTALATAKWLLGEAMIGLNAPEAAKPVIVEALALASRSSPGSKLEGDLLRSRATLSEMSGNAQGALKDYLQAYEIFRRLGQSRSEAIALQDIGNLYLEAGDFERVRRYYSQSLEAFDDDPWLNLATYNNRGQAYREEGKLDLAEAEYRLALGSARKLESPLLEARILTNLADAQIEAGRIAPAQATITAAARLVESGEGVGWRPFVYGVRAKIAARSGEYREAGALFATAFSGERLEATEMPFRELHEAAARVYERLGDGALALAHLKAFQRLDSEALRLTSTASSQLMAARFDFTNQNLRISRLKQGQLERDVLIERQRTQFRTNLFIALGLALSIILGLLSFGLVSLRRSRDQVRAANSELSATNVELEKALKARTDFLATTSHEIRTPLNGILGMSQVLLADRGLTSDMRERIEVLHGAGETMKSLVDDILEVAKMESGELAVEMREVSLTKLISDTCGLWREAAASKGLGFDCSYEDVPNRVVTDGDRLGQIISNLLSNAVKFTPTGRVSLEVRGLVTDGAETVEFAVRDTGVGLAVGDEARIFEPFTQVNNSTTREYSGTGLGLTISRRLATALGGDIAVESEPGRGSTFTLTLPLERVGDTPAYDENPAATGAAGLKAAAVLLVDRNASSHALMRMLLYPATASLEIVTAADEAVARLSRDSFDHVIIECAAVGDDPRANLKAIRSIVAAARSAQARTTLLALANEALNKAQLFAVGATQVILKPIAAGELIAALAEAYGPDADATCRGPMASHDFVEPAAGAIA